MSAEIQQRSRYLYTSYTLLFNRKQLLQNRLCSDKICISKDDQNPKLKGKIANNV